MSESAAKLDAFDEQVRQFLEEWCAWSDEVSTGRRNDPRRDIAAAIRCTLSALTAAHRETAEAVARERELCCEANRHANVGWRIALEAAQREVAELKRFLEETQLERQGYKKERDEAQRALVEAKAGIERLRENIKAEREMHQQTIAGTSMNKLAAIAGRQLSEDRLRLYQAAEARVAALEAQVDAAQQLCKTYFEIAEQHMTADEIRAARDERMTQAADYKARCLDLEAVLAKIAEALREAIEFADEGWTYAGDYLRDKHWTPAKEGLRAALAGLAGEGKGGNG